MRYEDYVPELPYPDREYRPFGGTPNDEHFCQRCKLYYLKLFNQGKTKSKFPLNCSFDRILDRQYVKPEMFDSQEEYELAWASIDPVTWGATFLDFHADWYQKEITNCTSQFKVARAGRRVGKSQALALYVLWKAQTQSKFEILIICPYESQVDLLFKKIRELISRSAVIQDTIKRDKQSPPQVIEFQNGSTITGFSAGAKSGAKSDKVRGQGGGLIVFDEVDYLEDADIETVMAVLADKPDTEVIFSSTPTGVRKRMFNASTDKDSQWKEFWYISAESPRWTQQAEQMFRSIYSAGGYAREFLAEYGEEMAGVFRSRDIQVCLKEFSLVEQKRDPDWIYTMGVDWNKVTGTHIVVVGKPTRGPAHYKMVDKRIIRRSEFTQHEGVQAVVDMDQKWGCGFIYVDAGYGSVQIEMLHKMDEHKGTDFKKRLKGIDMGSNIEIIDPLDKEIKKKPTKGFMVDMTARAVEQHLLHLPKSEDTSAQIILSEIPYTDIGVVQQMRSFKVEKISPTGKLTYSQDYEHTLTALMLAVLAHGLEYEDYKRFKFSYYAGHVGRLGEKTHVPTHDALGNPLPPSQVAMMREVAKKQMMDEEKEFRERLKPTRPSLSEGPSVPAVNKDGLIHVSHNGRPVSQGGRWSIGPRRFRNTTSTRRSIQPRRRR